MSRNFGTSEDIGNKIKRTNNLSSKEKFYEETIPEPANLAKVIAKFKEKGVVIWKLIKDWFP
jgi:hypothetical protein